MKKGLQEIAFIHYFTLEEINLLLTACGLKINNVQYVGYAKNTGDLVDSEHLGNILIEAKKK